MQVKKEQLEADVEQTGSKLGKEYSKAVYCPPAYLTYICMPSTSAKCQAAVGPHLTAANKRVE